MSDLAGVSKVWYGIIGTVAGSAVGFGLGKLIVYLIGNSPMTTIPELQQALELMDQAGKRHNRHKFDPRLPYCPWPAASPKDWADTPIVYQLTITRDGHSWYLGRWGDQP